MNELTQKYFNTKDAARYLGISGATLQKYRVLGCGPLFQRIGRKIVYQISDLDTWAKQKRHQATSEYKRQN